MQKQNKKLLPAIMRAEKLKKHNTNRYTHTGTHAQNEAQEMSCNINLIS